MEERDIENQLSETKYWRIVLDAEAFKAELGGKLGRRFWRDYFNTKSEIRLLQLDWLEYDQKQPESKKDLVLRMIGLNSDDVAREHLFYRNIVDIMDGKECIFLDYFGKGAKNYINRFLLHLNIKV